MSYKAFEKIKEHIEIEFIKSKSPEELNDIFVRLNEKIQQLQADKAELVEALEKILGYSEDFASIGIHLSTIDVTAQEALAKHKG